MRETLEEREREETEREPALYFQFRATSHCSAVSTPGCTPSRFSKAPAALLSHVVACPRKAFTMFLPSTPSKLCQGSLEKDQAENPSDARKRGFDVPSKNDCRFDAVTSVWRRGRQAVVVCRQLRQRHSSCNSITSRLKCTPVSAAAVTEASFGSCPRTGTLVDEPFQPTGSSPRTREVPVQAMVGVDAACRRAESSRAAGERVIEDGLVLLVDSKVAPCSIQGTQILLLEWRRFRRVAPNSRHSKTSILH